MKHLPVTTVCVKCRWHKCRDHKNHQLWYNHVCRNPDVQNSKMDPVTGGRPTEIIYCRDINKGDCPHYESKTQPKTQFPFTGP